MANPNPVSAAAPHMATTPTVPAQRSPIPASQMASLAPDGCCPQHAASPFHQTSTPNTANPAHSPPSARTMPTALPNTTYPDVTRHLASCKLGILSSARLSPLSVRPGTSTSILPLSYRSVGLIVLSVLFFYFFLAARCISIRLQHLSKPIDDTPLVLASVLPRFLVITNDMLTLRVTSYSSTFSRLPYCITILHCRTWLWNSH